MGGYAEPHQGLSNLGVLNSLVLRRKLRGQPLSEVGEYEAVVAWRKNENWTFIHLSNGIGVYKNGPSGRFDTEDVRLIETTRTTAE